MHYALVQWTLRIPGCRSLKEKRRVVRSLTDGLRTRFNVSVSEIGHQNLHNQVGLGLAMVSGDLRLLHRTVDRMLGIMEERPEIMVVHVEKEVF